MSETAGFLENQPRDYYCLVSKASGRRKKRLPPLVTGGDRLYVDAPVRIFSSEESASAAPATGEEPFYLKCLSCFLNIVRAELGIDLVVLDDVYECRVVAWRTPCQTTVFLDLGGRKFFLEGCSGTGVYWRPVTEKATTSPAFIMCGAQYLDCVLFKTCPNGWRFLDAEPVTLCSCWQDHSVLPDERECIVTADLREFTFYWAGISEEGFDFSRTAESAVKLRRSLAERVAKAIADVHINWRNGMMANDPDCSVNVLDISGRLIMKIGPA